VLVRKASLLALVLAFSGTALADVHLVRKADGSVVMFNDIGSGWRIRGKAPNDAYLIARRDYVSPFEEHIHHFAAREGVDPKLVKSVMLVESNFNPRAVSRKGACGLMQLMPGTARRFGVSNAFDPRENIRGGVEYLALLLSMFRGDVSLALAGYNAGEHAVEKYGGVPPYQETEEYIRRAMVVYKGTFSGPVLSGGFKGVEGAPMLASAPQAAPRIPRSKRRPALVAGAPVTLARGGGSSFLSNVAVLRTRPSGAPALGGAFKSTNPDVASPASAAVGP